MKRIDLRLDDDLYERLLLASKRHHRSLNGQIVAMLEAQLASTAPARRPAADTVDAATLHAVLTAHAGEIARVARGAPDDAHVLAVVDHAGRWLGAEAVAPGTLTPVAERAEREGGQGFYVPATCRSAGAVRAMIDDYLSDV
jgi:hypothetical protein